MGKKQEWFTPRAYQKEYILDQLKKLETETEKKKSFSKFVCDCIDFYMSQHAEVKGKKIPITINRGNLRKLQILIEAEEIPNLNSFIDHLIMGYLSNYPSSEKLFEEISKQRLNLTRLEQEIEEEYLKR